MVERLAEPSGLFVASETRYVVESAAHRLPGAG